MSVNAPSTRYVLQADDGRTVTNDTRTGVALTANDALSYVWSDPVEADEQRQEYEVVLGRVLSVRRQQLPTRRVR
jgi:hypothetical protein